MYIYKTYNIFINKLKMQMYFNEDVFIYFKCCHLHFNFTAIINEQIFIFVHVVFDNSY